MEMWFSEMHTQNVKISIRTDKQLYSAQSDYQRIDVFESPEFGRFVTLDGDIIFSEADEFIYNEMVTHVPMSVHPDVKKVLITILVLAASLIFLFVLRALIANRKTAKRRNNRVKRKQRRRSYIRSDFDDFDF